MINPATFNGMNCYYVPKAHEVSMTWKERLFSWPWRPLQKTKWVDNPACPPLGEFYHTPGNKLWGSEESFRKLLEQNYEEI